MHAHHFGHVKIDGIESQSGHVHHVIRHVLFLEPLVLPPPATLDIRKRLIRCGVLRVTYSEIACSRFEAQASGERKATTEWPSFSPMRFDISAVSFAEEEQA